MKENIYYFHSILIILGLWLESNNDLNKVPSELFRNIESLKYLRIVEPTEDLASNLSLQLENLEELRVVGSLYDRFDIPPDFLQTS